MWETLPEVVLATIFGHLGLLDKLKIRHTCTEWRQALYRPEVWSNFIYSDDYVWNELIQGGAGDSNLTRFHKFKNDILQCITEYGSNFRQVHIYLGGDASFELFAEIANCCCNVENFKISKSRHVQIPSDLKKTINRFLDANIKLSQVCIINISVKATSNNDPLPIGLKHSQNLTKLTLVNSFPSHSLSSLMYLVRLRDLTINPHNLHHSLINHLASQSLTRLNVVATQATKDFFFENMTEQHWGALSQHRNLTVQIYMGVSYEWSEKETLLKPSIPLISLVYRKCMWLRYDKLSELLPNYENTLEEFVDYSLNEGSYGNTESPYSGRQDKYIITIVQSCLKLQALAVKEKLSSSTILYLAHLNPSIPFLYMRDDMILYQYDLPDDISLPADTYERFKAGSTKEHFCETMSEILGREWKPLERDLYLSSLQSKFASFFE